MVNFKCSIAKNGQGEIVINGNYVSGDDPVLVERVILEEFDAQGNKIAISTQLLNMNIDPAPGAYLLHSQLPSGGNVKSARATACFVVIDKATQSQMLTL